MIQFCPSQIFNRQFSLHKSNVLWQILIKHLWRMFCTNRISNNHIFKLFNNIFVNQLFGTILLIIISSLRRPRSVLPILTKIILANSLFLSILDNADASYPYLTEYIVNKLEWLQNLAIRLIFCLLKFNHVSQFHFNLKWLSIRSRWNLHILSLPYCVLFNSKAPT